jgi:hypothetical protein
MLVGILVDPLLNSAGKTTYTEVFEKNKKIWFTKKIDDNQKNHDHIQIQR